MCFGRLNGIRAIYGLFARLVPNANAAAAKLLGFPFSMKIHEKVKNAKGKLVDTLEFSGEDQIALDYKLIQSTFGTDFYNIYPRQEVFNRFLKNIAVS